MSKLQRIFVANQAAAGEFVFSCIAKSKDAGQLQSIGLATGSTMLSVYDCWRNSTLDFSQVVTFNLDEYVGLAANNANSYAYFMHQQLFDTISFKKHFLLDGMASNLAQTCADYEAALCEHGLDIQLLGVGENGHIAFNEPGISSDSVTHLEDLTESTMAVNSRFFAADETIPCQALTMGIASILSAKHIIIVILGEKKRAALEKLMAGVVDEAWPVTYLLQHPHVTVVTDLV